MEGEEGVPQSFVISTTRPEMIAACVAVTAHPDDERFKPLFGKHAITPGFFAKVPIFPSEKPIPKRALASSCSARSATMPTSSGGAPTTSNSDL